MYTIKETVHLLYFVPGFRLAQSHLERDVSMYDITAEESAKRHYIPISKKTEDLRTGDILFLHATDSESQIIQLGTSSPWSHVGTVVKVHPSTVKALEEFHSGLPLDWRESWLSPMMQTEESESRCSSAFSCCCCFCCYCCCCPRCCASEPGEFGGGSRKQHLAELVFMMSVLKRDPAMNVVLERERRMLESDSRNLRTFDDERELYMWESTTSTTVDSRCVMTGKSGSGVKLTHLSSRMKTYDDPFGVRKLDVNPWLTGEKSSVFFECILLSLFTNIVLNRGKEYELDYSEMVDAWSYGGYCFTDKTGSCYEARRFFYCAFCCFFSASASDPNYHRQNEYESLYCSELTTQLLYDHAIVLRFYEGTFLSMRKLICSISKDKAKHVSITGASEHARWLLMVDFSRDLDQCCDLDDDNYVRLVNRYKDLMRDNKHGATDDRSLGFYKRPSLTTGRTGMTPEYLSDCNLFLSYDLKEIELHSISQFFS
jgi:hypothetical protein